MGKAILSVSSSLLEIALHLPEDYHITAAHSEMGTPVVQLLVESPLLPEVTPGASLPEMDLCATVEWVEWPDGVDYQKIIVTPHLKGATP